ncbi:hypothetical protein G6F57_005265 [Rhizopus arrhizus]|uniref:Uncharacterized protein n=1 Tax=Rhizopus oryzae TaxID=64495 RepID=A0A9P6X8D2_RHIOR|nr:hypothetical protein G6F23_003457 [Rhizopus arrhizus]KAG1423660.1 hypothetical protein G6F58_002731 [Rhizopus delemar]KAG0768124.1 hypothetical protein G6F24_002219 [Rhizopus arrhizus]KAG0793316.1 hypothetical protein G6F21_003708 [Rhizopus arrhizus]KAG0798961.1 hypothetical protein G6F22_003704 [Rhizopus arrhizus]
MNRLSFADFHAKHFGQEQQEYWKSFLQQQQFYSYQNTDEKLPHNTNLNPNDQSYEAFEDQNYNEDYPQEDQMEEEDDECHGLSKEAIEIFKFSEAYKKEREEERLKEEEEEEKGKEGWKFGESSVLCSGGIEAPVTCLVLTRNRESTSENLRMKEDLLNSAYFTSCINKDVDAPIVFWPVLPLRL